MEQILNISVFGLGYVGCVSAACLANDGHKVIGVDVDVRKVASIDEGRAPFVEPGLEELLQLAKARGVLSATTLEAEAVAATDMAMICVGTPSEKTGQIGLAALRAVFSSVGRALRGRSRPFVVILRSTVLPHVVEGELIPLLEASAGKKLGDCLQFCYNPEFLREGAAIRDYYEAPMIIVGHNVNWAAEVVSELYSEVKAPIIKTDISTACLVKYVSNMFHALKVAFANEVGQLSEALNVDGCAVMEIVCLDRKLNISPVYMKPGFAFGGSCLPKDVRAIVSESRMRGLRLPVIQGILASNKVHLETCINTILDLGESSVALLGLTFKEGTDDLRESPAVELAEALIGKGIHLKVYEPSISRTTVYGTNLSYVEKNIPHIWRLLTTDLASIARESKAIVLLRRLDDSEREILTALRADQVCIDYADTVFDGEFEARTIKFAQVNPDLVAR
jgi:GDP-mannose 6-dehydrogenase